MAILRKRDKENNPARRLRISVVDDDSHEQLFNFKTGRTNLIITLALAVFFIMAATYCLTAFTGLRRTVPGYPSAETKMAAMDNMMKVDSLEKVIDTWAFQVANIQRILNGQEPISMDSTAVAETLNGIESASREVFATSDSLLREEIRKQEESAVTQNGNEK